MNEMTGETRPAGRRSARFWLLAAVGFVFAFGAVLICGLLLGVGAYAVTNLTAPEAAVSEAAAAPASETEGAAAEDGDTAAAVEKAEPAGGPERPLPPRLGNPAADFTLPNLAGQTVSLADFKGQPVILNFWATWCGPCEAEMPEINQAYLAHKEDGLVVLAINLQEHPDTIKSFVNYYDLEFTILLDRDEKVGKLYGARALPTTYFIDRAGVIVHTYYGQMDEEALAIGLRKILP